MWFLHSKTGPKARAGGRLPALGWPSAYTFDFRDHSFLEAGGRVYDATFAGAFPSWPEYFVHMVRCAWWAANPCLERWSMGVGPCYVVAA